MKKFILIVCLSVVALVVFAQEETPVNTKADKKEAKRQRINAIIKQEEEGNLSFRKHTIFGIQLRTNGYGAFMEIGRRTSQRLTSTYSLELSEIKERKEEKWQSTENLFNNSYVYGKINNFYQAKLGYGQQYILGQKGNKNGVAVIALVQGGISAGLLKPYYLQLEDAQGRQATISYYDDSTAFLNPQRIFGAGGLGKGWNELKFKPGVYTKAGLRFDFGRYNERVQAMEIGLSLDYYFQKIPIMAYVQSRNLFFQGHVAFVFGSRK